MRSIIGIDAAHWIASMFIKYLQIAQHLLHTPGTGKQTLVKVLIENCLWWVDLLTWSNMWTEGAFWARKCFVCHSPTQSITNIRIHSDIRIILNEYIHIRKYSDSNKMLNIFGHSLYDFKVPRIYSDIHLVKK